MDITGIGTAVTGVKDILGMFFPDKTQEEKDKIAQVFQYATLIQQADKSQTDVNVEEAKSPNIFIAGWRPFIGWVCGTACAWNWIGISIVKSICILIGYKLSIDLQPASLSDMMPILLGLLGLGTLRTIEKIQGAEGNR